MTDLEDLEAEETLDEFTEDEASEPDLAALIPDNAVAAVCALRRGMFDYRSSPASRIAAARDVLDIALSWVENENRPAPLQPMHWGELLMRYLINEKRVREARKREAALRNSLESTLLEGEKECLPNEENEEPKNQASNRTSAEPATPQETRVLARNTVHLRTFWWYPVLGAKASPRGHLMNVTTVESTSLATVAYDDARKLLQLEFCSRAIYQYFGVPAASKTVRRPRLGCVRRSCCSPVIYRQGGLAQSQALWVIYKRAGLLAAFLPANRRHASK